jgi:hypothetical protein
LAICSVVDGRNVDGLVPRADPTLLAPGSTVALAISPSLFMRRAFVPLLAGVLQIDPQKLQVDLNGRISGTTGQGDSVMAAIDDTQLDLQVQSRAGIGAEYALGVSLDASSLALTVTPLHVTMKGGFLVGQTTVAVTTALAQSIAAAAASAGPRWSAGLGGYGGLRMLSGGLAGCFYLRGAPAA